MVTLTEDTVTKHYTILRSLSELHGLGSLYPSSDAIAALSGLDPVEVRALLGDAETYNWVTFSLDRAGWRLRDHTVAQVVPLRRLCDPCLYFERTDTPAIADCRTPGGIWGNVCARHFVALDCKIGAGLGQFYREV